MEVGHQRKVRSGNEYDYLFPRSAADTYTVTVKKNAGVSDTVAFIPKVVRSTLYQTKGIAAVLKAATVYDTCSNIWHFVYRHIAYQKDADGYEQVRSPSRIWHDRKSGVDCDCYSTFISSVLYNLGIPHKLRITKYKADYFQHIYPIAKAGGKDIIMDCVTDQFDYEVPYSEKKDFDMDLQYLNGLDASPGKEIDDLLNGSAFGNAYENSLLGRLSRKQKKAAKNSSGSEDPNAVPPSGVKKKKGFKKLLNIANKANPATILLRNGILASMKLNIGKAANRLRWTYLSPNAAKAKGIDMSKFPKLVAVRQKLENIFYGAGGKPENLKKAILKGKGNKDHAVNGFELLEGFGDYSTDSGYAYWNTETPLRQLLGVDMYHSENEAVSGLGALGEPVTATTISAASGVILAIVSAIKKVGDIFGGKGKGSEDFKDDAQDSTTDAPKEGVEKTTASGDSGSNSGDTAASSNSSTNSDTGSGKEDSPGGDSKAVVPSAADSPAANAATSAPPNNAGFWAANKKWLLPVSIGVGGLTVVAIGMKLFHSPGPVAHTASPDTRTMQGLSPKNHRRKTRAAKANQKHKKQNVRLL